MNDLQQRATAGESLPVESALIEQTLSELWRSDGREDDHAVTRAALWNVVAHAASQSLHARASEVLRNVANTVPQRTIIVHAEPEADASMSSWISANCHLVGDGKKICSEAIVIDAGGDRVGRVAPLVNALLIPDMPVAVWWVGDLPHENVAYVNALLEPADRLIVDSVNFDNPADLDIVERVSHRTRTAPADLNWVRGEEWRAATATVFDPPETRRRIGTLRRVRITADAVDRSYFGHWIEPLYFAAWIAGATRRNFDDFALEIDLQPAERCGLTSIELEMDDFVARIGRDPGRCVITTTVDGQASIPSGVTRTAPRDLDGLITRELKAPESDRLLVSVLPRAIELAGRIRR